MQKQTNSSKLAGPKTKIGRLRNELSSPLEAEVKFWLGSLSWIISVVIKLEGLSVDELERGTARSFVSDGIAASFASGPTGPLLMDKSMSASSNVWLPRRTVRSVLKA